MKTKRIIALISSAVMGLTISFTAAACGDKCDHVYNWTILSEATCSKTGVREGVCGICGKTTSEVIPIDADAHAYGEWEITVPTDESTGQAVKNCTANSSHTPLTVELPALTPNDAGYESEIITYPTQLQEGEKQLTYKHEAGDIIFNVPVSVIGIATVNDAVEVGAQFAHLVRKSYGSTTPDITKYSANKFYCEYGENLSHIIYDGDYKEEWYTLDDKGNIFGVETTGVRYNFVNGIPTNKITSGSAPKMVVNPSIQSINGFRFSFGYAGIMTNFYGAEGLLTGLYAEGKASVNNDFTEEVIERNGTNVYKFSFSSIQQPNYYSKIEAEFTLADDYTVKHVLVNSYAYDNSYEEKWVYDEDLQQYKPIVSEPSGIEFLEYNQISVNELDEEEVNNPPVSPYDREKVSIKSFDLKRGNTVYPDGFKIPINADQAVEYEFVNVENIGEGINSFAFDNINIFLRTDSGDTLLSAVSRPLAYTTNNSKMAIRFYAKGETTIVLKTESGSYEKVVVFDVAPKVPTLLSYEARVMETDSTVYKWVTDFNTPVYIGQELHFRSKLMPEEENYADSSYTAEIISSNKDSAELIQIEGTDEMIFKATATGRYTVEMTSSSSAFKTCSFVVNVESVPTPEYLLGEGVSYTGNLEYPAPGKVTVTSTMLRGTQGFVRVERSDGSYEQLSFTIENNVLTTTHSDGADLGFKLSLNNDYRLELSHTLQEFDDLVETIILVKAQ